MYHFVQTSLEAERKPQRRREKSKAHPLFLPRRKAQTQEKKGNRASVSASSTLNECDRTFSTSSSLCSCSSSNTNSRSETSDDTPGSFVNTFPRAANTSDPIRVKCREMLANALQTGGKPAAVAFALNVACDFFVYPPLSVSLPTSDDYIAIGADCDELGAQIEDYILAAEAQSGYITTSSQHKCVMDRVYLFIIINLLDTFLFIGSPHGND